MTISRKSDDSRHRIKRHTKKRTMSAADYAHGNLSANTYRAYASDIAHFRERGGSIPATVESVIDYLTDQGGWLTVSTLKRRLMAIRHAHVELGLWSPTDDPSIKAVMRGIRREYGSVQRQAKPLLRRQLRKTIKNIRNDPIGIRDKALLLLGFAGAFRRSELVALDVGDIERVKEGYLIQLRCSKTDQERYGRTIAIPKTFSSLCSVAAVERWLRHSHIERGPLFQSLNRSGEPTGNRLHAGYVSQVLKQRLQAVGINADDYSAHSLRAGLVTEAAKAGVPNWKIMQITGHKTDGMVSCYIRDVDLFTGNAAQAVM